MNKRIGPVWVIAEQNGGVPEIVSLQLIGKARELAGQLGTVCEAVLLGREVEGAARELIRAGAERVYVGEDPALELYQPFIYGKLICSLVEQYVPEIILIGSTCMGRELAPLVAARLKTGLAAHCTGLELDSNGNLKQLIPAYGGLMSIVCPEKRPQMATVARGVFQSPDPDENRTGEIIRIDIMTPAEMPVRTLEIVTEGSAGAQMEDAQVIVTGGAGACGLEGWEIIRELARTLDAPLACTRPAVDAGWAPLECMIGQSGKMVSPQVYIGVGLSGEQQHMVGITGAALMVGVNNDPKSPIFEQVDIGIVENCQDFLPVLVEKIKEYRASRSKGC